ncbi:porin [Hyphomicrobium sp.]|uniref:porin n=1 Tax=Hyphomicrobium sp. TaxID=82 RepID=UPI00345BAA82
MANNCCADLEERIAELEATTARKGNRKVSLTVSGWVGEQVMWWDDGVEQNVYVVGLGSTLASHFKMTGQATISPGWYAGYVLHIEAISSDSLTISQANAIGPAALAGTGAGGFPGYATQLLQSFWFVKSDHLGKLSVGLQSQASDNTAILVDGSGSLVPANWVAFEYNSFNIINSATGVSSGFQWGDNVKCFGGGTIGDCNGATQHVVRYDSPTFGGFSVSASWGEDDMWDVAARYAGEFNGFKFAAAAAYNEISGFSNVILADTFKYFQVGAYLEHVPTGIFVYGAYGHNESDLLVGDADTYYVKAGLRERWHPLGHTVLYGEYENAQGDDNFALQGALGQDSEFQLWGVGVVQEIDAAAMSLWVSYRHLDQEDSTAIDFEDFQYVKAGALINF